jgi:hypothetical protein
VIFCLIEVPSQQNPLATESVRGLDLVVATVENEQLALGDDLLLVDGQNSSAH